MKKYPKIVQCDKRGQIVIPKDLRNELGIEEGTGFWMYAITDEGILLKKVENPELGEHTDMLHELNDKADKIDLSRENLGQSIEEYKKKRQGNLDVI
ncbi:AbrB/MazE/SpoVT family DNA-binding domain-containing protein [Candidatus Woesearchaeota archaeon]|nr:AbrB/MazE/SpoVT family DNA-binding domain-containing protein [Candidatus Woesearchaeota archaeon]